MTKSLRTFFLIALLPVVVLAQDQPPRLDTLPPAPPVLDTLEQDTSAGLLRFGARMSPDSLDAPVDYSAEDSMRIDVRGEKIHLYGNAQVSYQDVTLKAAHIILDWKTSIIEAEPLPDSVGQPAGLPEFSDGTQQFTANGMRYNFETRKGIVYDVVSSQDDIIVRGTRSKFVSGVAKDSLSEAEDIIYSEDALFTTCTAPIPHYGIRTQRAKVVPDKLAVVGPSNLEIMNVPTPLWLPFGFFPISSGRSTGLIFPNDYEYSPQWGFGLRDLGWYFPLGEHVNLTATGNIYLRGTWGVAVSSQYRRRYKYNGNLRLSYDRLRTESNEGVVSFTPGFAFNWSHQQDAAAHPTNRFGGSINFQTNNIQQQVRNDFQTVTRNLINSNLSFSKTWLDKPISLSLALSHSQNTNTREVTVNFPQFQFQTQTLYPFRRRERVGPSRWYEDITLRYANELRGTFTGTDTTFFSNATLDQGQLGFSQRINSGTSFKILNFFNLNPSVDYREVWYAKSLERTFDPTQGLIIEEIPDPEGTGVILDTVSYGTITEELLTGFSSYRTFSAGVSLNTQVFGTVRFGRGLIRGLRHVMKPSISFGYQPNYLNPELNYFPQVDAQLNPGDVVLYKSNVRGVEEERSVSYDQINVYNRFAGTIFGGPPQSEKQMAISYSLNNIFEAKVFSRRDSTTKNIRLFDNIVVNGSYNFQADSLKWSPINVGGNTRFFKGVTSLSVRAQFDPYERLQVNNRLVRVNRTTLSESRVPFKLTDFTGSIATNLTVAKIRALFQGVEEEVVEDIREEEEEGFDPEQPQELPEETDFLSLFENFSIMHNINFNYRSIDPRTGRDTLLLTANSIEVRGSIRLTDNWSVNIGSIGYDFVSKNITYPFLSLQRDLHCWQMSFSWAPQRNYYSFTIGVKPGTLDFLNIPYTRNNVDGRRLFGTQ